MFLTDPITYRWLFVCPFFPFFRAPLFLSILVFLDAVTFPRLARGSRGRVGTMFRDPEFPNQETLAIAILKI